MTAQRLHLLLVFAAIGREGSITRAARSLGVTKSVVSGHLRTLEASLGVRLVQRTTRRLALTQVGEQAYESVQRMLEAAGDVDRLAESEMEAPSGTLRVASTVDLARLLVAPALASVCQAWPSLRVQLHTADRPVDILAEGLDAAVRVGVPPDSSFRIRKLADDQCVLLASPGLAQRWSSAERPRDLAAAPWLFHAAVDQPRKTFHAPGRPDEGFVVGEPHGVADNTDALRTLAAAGLGFAELPSHIAADDLATGRLVRVLAPWFSRPLSIYVLTPSRRQPRRVVALFEALDDQVRARLGGLRVGGDGRPGGG
jgi:DNA-binding transcriptional LysR family regulator